MKIPAVSRFLPMLFLGLLLGLPLSGCVERQVSQDTQSALGDTVQASGHSADSARTAGAVQSEGAGHSVGAVQSADSGQTAGAVSGKVSGEISGAASGKAAGGTVRAAPAAVAASTEARPEVRALVQLAAEARAPVQPAADVRAVSQCTRHFSGVPLDRLRGAVEKVLYLIDPPDMTIRRMTGQGVGRVVAERSYHQYAVLGARFGVDTWVVTLRETADAGCDLEVLAASVEKSGILASPPKPLQASDITPATSVLNDAECRLFFDRVAYFLGERQHWYSCRNVRDWAAENGYHSRFDSLPLLCGNRRVGVEDQPPDYLKEHPVGSPARSAEGKKEESAPKKTRTLQNSGEYTRHTIK